MRGLFVDVTRVSCCLFLFYIYMLVCGLGLLVCVLLRNFVVLFCWLLLLFVVFV